MVSRRKADPERAVTVHRYGTPSWVQLPDVVIEQLRLAHELANTLVEISRRADEQRAKVYSEHPAVAQAEAELAKALEVVTDEHEKHQQLRRAQRTRSPKDPAGAARRKEAREKARACRLKVKEAKEAFKEQAKPLLAEVGERKAASTKALYPAYRDKGLYWAVINDVMDHHLTAEKRVIELRKQGRAADLRFRSFKATGALAVQPQRQAGMRPRDPQLLASGEGPWKNVIRLGTWVHPDAWGKMPLGKRRREARSTITIRIGDELVQLPAVLHRMLPPDADVTGARLVVRRVAADTRVSVSITASIPKPDERTSGPAVALHGGWRREDDDSIRVATWRFTQPVTVPASLADVVRANDDGVTGIVVLPAAWRAGLARPDEIRSKRDLLLEPVRAELVAWLEKHPQPDEDDGRPPITAGNVAKWRSPGRFAALAIRWAENPPVDSAAIVATLEKWRVVDLGLWTQQEHGREKHLGRRKDAYRRVAAWLARTAGRIVVDDTDIASLTRAISKATEDDPTPADVTRIPAKQRVDAAPGELRAAVLAAAKRDGVPDTTVPAVNLTREHTCGHIMKDEPTTRPILCHGCGRYYDPDTSATLLQLMRAEQLLGEAFAC